MAQSYHSELENLIKTHKADNIESILNTNFTEYLQKNNITLKDVIDKYTHGKIGGLPVTETDEIQWKFVYILCHCLIQLAEATKNESESLLSVNQKKNIRSGLQFVVSLGILPALLPGVGIPIEKRSEHFQHCKSFKLPPLENYERLKMMCNLLTELCTVTDFKMIIFNCCFGDYLAMLYQLSYAPIKKPSDEPLSGDSDCTMTVELWNRLQAEQKEFKSTLQSILSNTYRPLIMKELIVLQGIRSPMPPTFMKKALSKQLSLFLTSEGGLLCLIKCFLDSPNIDTGTQWKHIEMISKLIAVKHGSFTVDDYLSNICKQLKSLVHSNESDDYTMIAAACLTNLSDAYKDNKYVKNVIFSIISQLIIKKDSHSLSGTLILSAQEVDRIIKTLHLCFTVSKLCLPAHLLTNVIYSIFCLRIASTKSSAARLKLNDILMLHFSSECCKYEDWFSALIFRTPHKDISIVDSASFENTKDGIIVSHSNETNLITVESAVNNLLEMINEYPGSGSFACKLFIYFLSSMTTIKTKMNKNITNRDLLVIEDDVQDVIDKDSESYLVILKALENLASMESVLKYFTKNPNIILTFLVDFLVENTKSSAEINNEECIMISLILLSTILSENNNNDSIRDTLEYLKKPLKTLLDKTSRDDLKFLCQEVYNILMRSVPSKSKESSRFDLAISEVCDPLLPIRAHGLMQLSKLIEEKDPESISKKQYIQCIFQENLKDEDSYVYLTAINGLASLANYFTEDVLEILTGEFMNSPSKSQYTNSSDEDNIMMRMKIGEVLVKITKNLGEMAPVHKNILLNTFLCGCGDPDDLIRASSLSNLAEVSRVLSYKLGSIIFDILKCINNILEGDKSPQCRRAAVLVISSLLKGLGNEALHFLKESLLPIYRTLKRLYNDQAEDSVVRLHAQIALEELNSIVKELLFPQLQMEKKIFLLDN